MKAVILAGGLGTRLSEETSIKPKPMVEVGGKPILWHMVLMISSFVAAIKGTLLKNILLTISYICQT
jgi:NDP-sugar pyrophosphorylase family protein